MKQKQSLNGSWRWHTASSQTMHEGLVPGSVLADMLRIGLVSDPFWRTNEYDVREEMLNNYTYLTQFEVEPAALEADDIELVFEGLDTIAEIWLNNRLLAKVNNMHRTHRLPVKGQLYGGKNQLEVRFLSSLAFVRAEDATSDIFYASTGSIHGNATLRKAHYMFGWDWGPQLPDMGIFRPVYLETFHGARLQDVRLHQQHSDGVTVFVNAKAEHFTTAPLMLCVVITAPDGQSFTAQTDAPTASRQGCAAQADAPKANRQGCATQADAPAAGRQGCVTQADAPAASRQGCATQADAPAASRQGCATQADAPAASRQGCAAQADAPAANRQGCVTQADAPAANRQGCVTQADAPAASRQGCATQADAPAASRQGCVTQADAPAASHQGCATQADAPAASRQGCATQADAPAASRQGCATQADAPAASRQNLPVYPLCEKYNEVAISIPTPKLWWPNGLGEQPLYKVQVTLCAGDEMLDSFECRMGLRTVTVSTAPDEWGNEFAFVVNGEKIFAMGANYIPEDSLLTRGSAEKSRALIQSCADANFNMLRVWGGGYYPDTHFYDACDELGILVWQDLMFACNVYALDDAGDFEQNIIAETVDNATRLRHHACLALWCGNNEMEWGWGDEWQRLRGHHPRYKADYIKIFEHILARTLKQVDPFTFWWPSSPSSGGAFDKPNHPDYGDQHYWEVWHSGKPFTEYRNSHFRFCSEYGFQSFPSIKSIRSFTLPKDRNIFSEVMESHQKNGAANSKIFSYVADYFLYPKDLDSIAYISQVLQLKAIQYGVEHWRQNRGRCMGSLYWQLNDCWPVASWASIDYYSRWKALHHGARRFYAPVTATAREETELSTLITYYVHNDTLTPKAYTLEVELLTSFFEVLHHQQCEGIAPPLSATPVLRADFTALLEAAEPNLRKTTFARYRMAAKEVATNKSTLAGNDSFAHTEKIIPYAEKTTINAEGTTLFVKPKHFALPTAKVSARVAKGECGFTLTLSADAFMHFVEVSFADCDPLLSNNFFDITSSKEITLTMDSATLPKDITAKELEGQLRIRSVKDSYKTE